MEKAISEILEKRFAKGDIGKDYSNNDYVKPHLVIRRLNKAFGQDGWQFIPEERVVEGDTIVQFGKIGIQNESGEWIWKHNCGARNCSYIKNTEKRLDVGNDYKSAVSNCLKRCAMMLGVALDLYGEREQGDESGQSTEDWSSQKSTPETSGGAKQGQGSQEKGNTGKGKAKGDMTLDESIEAGETALVSFGHKATGLRLETLKVESLVGAPVADKEKYLKSLRVLYDAERSAEKAADNLGDSPY